ncbi:chemosensory receptor B [Elysia marginata]|uniref:Chemosensory receptor B n=1 Tax=Elysia marginata TaxID=1093978 RepID=A0AAV4IYD7_9GAST|nr:chemosensory receptor B [Elysia marginata]
MSVTPTQVMILSKPAMYSNTTDPPITPLVSYHVYTIIMFVLGFTATNAVALFGVFSNTANIIVYYKMGLQETTNISFFTLAINDVVVCLAFIVVEICHSPFMKINELPSGSFALQCSYIASFVAYLCCGFGSWITAVLSTERCLCIALPLKVSIGQFILSTRSWLRVRQA